MLKRRFSVTCLLSLTIPWLRVKRPLAKLKFHAKSKVSLKAGRVLTYIAREGIHVDKSGPGVDSLPQVKYPVVREVSGQHHLALVVEKGDQKGRNGHLLNVLCIEPIKLHGNQVNNGE